MKLFAKNIENEIMYLKLINHTYLNAPFSTLSELLEHSPSIQKHIYANETLMLNNDKILNGNFISSPVTSVRITNFQKHTDSNPLKDKSFSVVKKKTFSKSEKNVAVAYYRDLINDAPVTISPNDPSSSYATTNIKNLNDFNIAWDKVIRSSNKVTIETYQKGDLFKIFIANNKIIAVYGIVPAFVIGDGISTISELINQQNKERQSNLFYKDKFLKNVNNSIQLNKVIENKEIVRLKNSLNNEYGAQFIDISEIVKGKFEKLAHELEKKFVKINYLELTCYSDNILAGSNHPDLYVRDIKQNTADLTVLFSCQNEIGTIKKIMLDLFPPTNYEKRPPTLEKSSSSTNPFLKNATQFAILQEAAYRKGLNVTKLDSGLTSIKNSETGLTILFSAGMPIYTTLLARKASNDKFITKQLLQDSHLNTPQGFKIAITKKNEAWNRAQRLKIPFVIKPLDGSGGIGVSTGISSKEDFDRAWDICEELKAKLVLIEEHVEGNDYRIIVIKNTVCAVTQRIAAYVVGDGIHTIDKLIKIKAALRKNNPFFKLKKFIVSDIMIHYLSKNGLSLNDIPQQGQYIQLLDAVNIGSGGESIDRTDEIHPDWIQIAINARKSILNSFHVGLDLMAEDIRISPLKQKWSLIEVNTNPDLGLQLFPQQGLPRDIGSTLLDNIFGKTEFKSICYHIKLYGKVQAVGFRKWFKAACDLRSITGYIHNTDDPELIEGTLVGLEPTVIAFLKLCYIGPELAQVTHISLAQADAHIHKETYNSFTIS